MEHDKDKVRVYHKAAKNQLVVQCFSHKEVHLIFPTDHDIFSLTHITPENSDLLNKATKVFIAVCDVEYSRFEEWEILYHIIEYSKTQNAVFELYDDDGEFILTAFPELLPEWITPQNELHHVYIKGGNVMFTDIIITDPLTQINDECINIQMTEALNRYILDNKRRNAQHRTIALINSKVAQFLNSNTELFGLIINMVSNGLVKESDFTTSKQQYGETKQCQIIMTNLQFARYYNFMTKSTEDFLYQEKLGEILTSGLDHIIRQEVSIQDHHVHKDYNSLFDSYKVNGNSSNQLIEDVVTEIDMKQILHMYKGVMEPDKFEERLKGGMEELLGVEAGPEGFVGFSDGLDKTGGVQENKFNDLFDEMMDDLKEGPDLDNESHSDEDEEDVKQEIEFMKQMDAMIKTQNEDFSETHLGDALEKDQTATTSVLFSKSFD
ncbi:hypothetical protein EIN_175570 [Entamoeba invadens IP1]|uniref:hypothetical protein n=1 Tax=Entamoeba invadens IP1 TaxID=370355 RepID=UPI0002C3FA7D|nr:hypothetical protein EIN_175570 [Entamoeba invadens IP1]ELP93770.1 hypothetical protein EIN_175570 [Entamoeba invadens IP1]|eukprot:XP_004260541.1 hypothetical protein EIN_175570 [Entamoeba invadens IP1]